MILLDSNLLRELYLEEIHAAGGTNAPENGEAKHLTLPAAGSQILRWDIYGSLQCFPITVGTSPAGRSNPARNRGNWLRHQMQHRSREGGSSRS